MRSLMTLAAATAVLALGGCAAKPEGKKQAKEQEKEKEREKPKGERVRMTLEISGGRTIADPSDEDIRSAIAGLDTRSGDAFVILGPTDMTYIQASGDRRVGFDLEHQEGSVDRHFRAKDEALPLEDVAAAFIAYRAGEEGWKRKFEFERVTW